MALADYMRAKTVFVVLLFSHYSFTSKVSIENLSLRSLCSFFPAFFNAPANQLPSPCGCMLQYGAGRTEAQCGTSAGAYHGEEAWIQFFQQDIQLTEFIMMNDKILNEENLMQAAGGNRPDFLYAA